MTKLLLFIINHGNQKQHHNITQWHNKEQHSCNNCINYTTQTSFE